MKKIHIERTDYRFVREPLISPFGFKGRYLDELWQSVVYIESTGARACCPGTISVLWSDSEVFAEHSPRESSSLMNDVTVRALEMLSGADFVSPDLLIGEMLPELKKYADRICGRTVAETFVLNALVGVDYALWTLFARENGISDFEGIIPDYAKNALSARYDRLAHIPLISYAVGDEDIKKLLGDGSGLLKIKIGHSENKKQTHEEDMRSMLEWDKNRLLQIHTLAREYSTGLTENGHVRYYLDANGRYDSVSRLNELICYADGIGALENIELIEEPLPPSDESDVSRLPVLINADESAHSLECVKKRISQGYRAVALKPIAKTMSVSFAMAACVAEAGGSCLCADLTVVPLLAEWNKQFAARIGRMPGMSCGALEINGNQNYVNWNALGALLPQGMPFESEPCGVIRLPDDYFQTGSRLFSDNGYLRMFENKNKQRGSL